MNQILLRTAAAASLSAALACGLAGCNKGLKGDETSTTYRDATGAEVVDTFDITATVTAIDATNRKVTLKSAEGGQKTYTAAPSTDLSQFNVGDTLSIEVTEEVAVALGGDELNDSEAGAVAVSADGSGDEVLMADTATVTATVTKIETRHRKVTLQFPDGSSKTVKVSKKIDLSLVTLGDPVTVQIAESLAVEVNGG